MKSKKNRILVMVNDVQGGGAERVADTHIRLLQECGQFDVAAATCGEPLDDLAADHHFCFRDFRNSPVTKIMGALGLGVNRSDMDDCLHTFRPHIIHIHAFVHFTPSALLVLESYKRETNCLVVLTHHNYSYICPNDALFNYRTGKPCEKCVNGGKTNVLRELCYGNFAGSWGKYIQKKQFYSIFSRGLVDVHLAPGSFMRKKLQEAFPRLQVTIVHNPCLSKVKQNIPAKSTDKMVYFGRISREKNVLAAVKAMDELKLNKINLLLIGDGPEADTLERTIGQSDAKRNIQFLRGFLPQKELYSLIEDVPYYILPSIWYENSPVAIIEALDMGMTPLVADRGGMKELLDWASVGYGFDPEDTDSIVEAVGLAVDHREQDQMLLAGPLRNKLETFTESAYLQKILALYHGLLEA